jgi:plastocyanin
MPPPMDNETLFYIFGIGLAVSAVAVSFLGLKLKDFPGKAFPVVVVWFAIFVGGATTFAVLHAKDEEKAKAAETEAAGEKFEAEGEDSEAGEAATGETEGAQPSEGEVDLPGEAEGPVTPEEPVGPKEGSGKAPAEGGQKGEGKPQASADGASTTLQLAADATALAFDTTELSAKAGEVTIDFDNPSPIAHDVAIEEGGKEIAASELITEGKDSVSAELEPGTYTFLCTVPGHAEAGMTGTLTVE